MLNKRHVLLLSFLTLLVAFNTVATLRMALVPSIPRIVAPTLPVHSKVTTDRVPQLGNSRFTVVTGNRRSDLFPDVPLTDQHGNVRRFRSDIVRDSIVCVVLFYTECQGTCPGTTQMMKRLRKSMKDEFATEPLKFVSITLDPDNDTPDDLLAYAENNGIAESADMPEWIFCTGTFEDIESIRMSLGLYDLDPIIDADRTQHGALLTIGNDHYDRWAALPAGLNYSDLSESFLRIVGTTERQRFASRISRSAQLTGAAAAAKETSCCTQSKPSVNTSCCTKSTESPDLPDTGG